MDSDSVDEVMSELEDFLESQEREQEAEEDEETGSPGEEPRAREEGSPDRGKSPGHRAEAEAPEPPEAVRPEDDRDATPAGREELGEEAELRRGLEVLEELIELRPGELELRARRLRYLRRLGEEEQLARRECELAVELDERGHRRAARLLSGLIHCESGGDDRTRDLLSPLLGVDEAGSAGRLGPVSGSSAAAGAAGDRPGGRLRQAVRGELALHAEALPWLHRAAGKVDADDEDLVVQGLRDYARYLAVRGRPEEACGVLDSALDAGAASEETRLDVRTDLAECLLGLGRAEAAREHLEDLARRDEAFGVVWNAVA